MSLQIVSVVRSKYPTPLGDKHADFLLEVAAALGLGLVSKTQGTRVALPSGQEVSQDVVMTPFGKAWDILSDGEGVATPVFNQIDPISPERFIAVPAMSVPSDPNSTQGNPPVCAVDLQPVLQEIKQLKAMITASVNFEDYTGQQIGALADRLSQIENQVDLLLAKELAPAPEFPAYTGRFSAWGVMRFVPELFKK